MNITNSKSNDLGGEAILYTDSVSNYLLKFTSYQVIKSHYKRTGSNPRGVFFNKAMSLTHRILKNEYDIDICLPHYWYRYGDQTHIRGMPKEVGWNHENPFKTIVKWNGDIQTTSNDAILKKIRKIVDYITEKYDGKNKQIIQEVYKYAPYEFQRNILECRGMIVGWRNALNWDSKIYKTISKPVILDALNSFPDSEFQDLKKPFYIFKYVTESLLEKDDFHINLFSEFCESFWFWFCDYLRLKRNARENIPDKVVSYWLSQLDFENMRYRRIIGDLLIDIANFEPDILEDRTVHGEYAWRIDDFEETKMMLNELNLT